VESPLTGTDQIRVEQLEIFARVGVAEHERANPQRLTLTITVWTDESFDNLEDDITRTANYSAICATAREYAREHSTRLIETLAAGLAAELLKSFPIRKVELELRKFVLPDAKHVAVIVVRNAALG
jgi:dihydroneopterin aldolase/2-amino-4-hydroxy-6-hydroxymethyldihydropteridine diphosphokinase